MNQLNIVRGSVAIALIGIGSMRDLCAPIIYISFSEGRDFQWKRVHNTHTRAPIRTCENGMNEWKHWDEWVADERTHSPQ